MKPLFLFPRTRPRGLRNSTRGIRTCIVHYVTHIASGHSKNCSRYNPSRA